MKVKLFAIWGRRISRRGQKGKTEQQTESNESELRTLLEKKIILQPESKKKAKKDSFSKNPFKRAKKKRMLRERTHKEEVKERDNMN